MKILRKILFVLGSLIALVLIVALFVKSEYAVERQTVIDKPAADVFNYVKYLKNQDNYSVWASMDPQMKKDYRGTDATVGFVSAWDSENKDVGKGEQEITKITEGQRIDFVIRFIEPFESTDYAYMTTQSENDSTTRVTWAFNGKMKYPMNMMLLFMDMEGMLGGDLEKGLANLKGIMEK
ncbi:MAG: SRPBCC family protein [Lentimicrobiaceae bacterium]|nr:SRPBCC family protein [Lentimicrobiaceae bacterium]MCB9023483.1 SRPBCC family protein [Lentimicrobiaceae bacterium]MCO5265330.1 SRPBCC family protein [Lentimicrobium sp.]